jgi:hypothetical protein
LVADHHGAVRKRCAVPATFGLLPGRVSYVIVFNSQFRAAQHVAEAMRPLQSIARRTTAARAHTRARWTSAFPPGPNCP